MHIKLLQLLADFARQSPIKALILERTLFSDPNLKDFCHQWSWDDGLKSKVEDKGYFLMPGPVNCYTANILFLLQCHGVIDNRIVTMWCQSTWWVTSMLGSLYLSSTYTGCADISVFVVLLLSSFPSTLPHSSWILQAIHSHHVTNVTSSDNTQWI